ncbi:CpsD/CapB family tyrosine-protein kinase [Roseovarius aquimarinus]|uniref:CpsD/CapB family tyrosine-protein kinase n=1 Tax=Roseovarius aquimarinus TaxID=1229156 RepID=A0ABW7I4D2_9RHOB
MFQRFKESGRRTERKPQGDAAPQKDDDLPFDLELTRRVRGARMAPKWGTRDPAEPPLMGEGFDAEAFEAFEGEDMDDVADLPDLSEEPRLCELVLRDDIRSGWSGAWDALPTARFGHGSAPLEVQARLLGQDRAILRAFDDLRTQLLRTMHGAGWSRIAITAPTGGSGASFTALNLALCIARIPGMRALLIDLDQRDPSIAAMLGMRAGGGLQALLAGEIAPEEHLVKPCGTLALGLGRGRSETASELLHARQTGAVVDDMLDRLHPDIALFDLPAMLEHDDLEAFLPHVDGVLLVADATRTLAPQITECERRLEGKTNLLGIILNRTRPERRSRAGARRAA